MKNASPLPRRLANKITNFQKMLSVRRHANATHSPALQVKAM